MAKSPTRTPKKASSPVKGRNEKPIKHNVNESDFKSVKIKREALKSDYIMKGNQSLRSPLKNVTPEPKKNKQRRPKKEKSPSISNTEKPSPMNTKPEAKKSEKTSMIVTQENVLKYLMDTPIDDLLKLKVENMHNVIQMWKKYKGLAEIQDIKSVAEAFLNIELEDMKNEATQEQITIHLKQQLEMEVDEDLLTAKNVDLNKYSTIHDIEQYDIDELAYFYHHHFKDTKMDIDATLDLEHSEVVELIASHFKLELNEVQGKSNPSKVQELEHAPTRSPEEKSNPMSTKKHTLPSSLRTSKQARISVIPQGTFEITADLTDAAIESATLQQLQDTFHQFSIHTGEEIQKTQIDKWDLKFLKEIVVTKRNNLQIQKRMLNQMNKKEMGKNSLKSIKKKPKLRQTNLLNPTQTKRTCRYSLHFTIPSNYKGTDGLREFLSLIFTEMIKYGEELCLLPWSTDAIVNPIKNAEEFPTTITGLTKYFEGARSPESSMQMFLKICLGYAIEMKKDNFDADVQGWCKAQSIRMYECSVQHPNVRSCGWLVYAPRTMNQQKWCQKVVQIYEAKYDTKGKEPFQLGLTWRALNGQWEVDRKEKVRAMHIDAPVEIAPRVKNFLRILAQHKRWPLNVRFRVMDEFSRYMKESTKQKYRYMVSKHTSLLAQLGVCECTQILNLDKRIGTSQMTLRDVILNVRDKTDGYRVFGSIDEKWNSDTIFVATYRPDKSTLTYDFVRSLSTYVAYLFPETSLKRILTPQAIDKAKDEQYNPASQSFTTQEDIDLDREIQADLDDDSMNFAAPDDLTDPFQFDESIRLVGGDSVWDLNGDEDTVSTHQPNGMGNVSFDSAVCRMYDTNSCASSVNSTNSRAKESSSIKDTINEEINKLSAPLPDAIQEDESQAEGAEYQ